MNAEQITLLSNASFEEKQDSLNWANEVLENWEHLITLLEESGLGQVITDFPNMKKMIEFMDEFRISRNLLEEHINHQKGLIKHE